MSAIDSLGSTSNPSSTTDAFSALSSGEFLEIIFTELTNQDPLEPADTQSMLNQLSTLRTIESDTQMVSSLQRLVSQSELASASQLIGSLVSGISLDNRRVSDLVISVSMTQDGPVLNMFDGSRMFFSNVDEIVGPIEDFIDDPDDPTDPVDPDDPDDPSDPTDPNNPADSIPIFTLPFNPDGVGSVPVGDVNIPSRHGPQIVSPDV